VTLVDFMLIATILLSIVFFGGAAVLAFSWAVKDGQFTNFERASRAIFDPDEPLGEITDRFPGAPDREIDIPNSEKGEIGPMPGSVNRLADILAVDPRAAHRERTLDESDAELRR